MNAAIDIDLAIMDRDSLRDEVAFLHRQVDGLREELDIAIAELTLKMALLTEAEQRLADGEAAEDPDGPAVVIKL